MRKTRRQGQYEVRKFLKVINEKRVESENVLEKLDNIECTRAPSASVEVIAEDINLNTGDSYDSEVFDWHMFDSDNMKVNDASDDDDYATEKSNDDFLDDLRGWSADCNVPMSTMSKLLKILRKNNMGDVPTDARTLVSTPRSGTQNIQNMSGGRYIYFGIRQCLTDTLAGQLSGSVDKVVVDINIDGLPIFKSRNLSVWPIQMAVTNNSSAPKPFVVAIFCGTVKPQDQAFLSDTIQELKELQTDGFNGMEFQLRYIICDAPARALVKGIIQFNGRYGCDRCEIRGVYADRRMLFLHEGPLRTDESFRTMANREHHKYESAFLELNVNMIKQFPLDVMHCVDLGVTKRLLLLWKTGPKKSRFTSGQFSRISDICEAIRNCFPSAFNRKPRRMDELKLWKATEFRTFLLYVGPVVLKDVIDKETYRLFLCLTVAISILSNPTLVQQHAGYAENLLKYFVSAAIERYEQQFCSYNVHCLLHLTTIAREAGCLGECSAYKFENNMTAIKRSVRGSADPLTQIANRLLEKRQMGLKQSMEAQCFQVKENSCYELMDGRLVKVVAVRGDEFVVEEFVNLEPLFYKPCNSKLLGMYTGSTSKTEMNRIRHHQIKNEAIAIPNKLVDDPLSNAVSLLTLNHTRDARFQR